MADDPSVPHDSRSAGSSKQGAAIGGWVCFGLGVLIMYWSVWTFILYVPLFFVAFVLSIVAMAQRRILLGLALLLATILIPLIEWFALAATRTNKFLDTQIQLLTPPTPPASKPQAEVQTSPAPNRPPAPVADRDQLTRDQILREPINGLHAWQLTVAYNGFLAHWTATDPAFSPDGESLLFAQQTTNSVEITIYSLRDHKLVKHWQPAMRPTSLAWSPDADRIAYKTESGLRVVELATSKDIALPITGFFGFPRDRFAWLPNNKMVCPVGGGYGTLTLDLDSLQITQGQASAASVFASGRDHPSCKVFQQEFANVSCLYVGETDESYARVLLDHFPSQTPYFVSPDLRHVIISRDAANGVGLPDYTFMHLMLGSRPAPELDYQIDLDLKEGSNCSNCAGGEAYLEAGVPFFGDVCAASTNPLNGKLIGPNPQDFKGRVRVTKWKNGAASVRVALELKPINEGDIVNNIQSEQWGKFGNWAWKFPGIWRALKSKNSPSRSDSAEERGVPEQHAAEVKKKTASELFVGTWRIETEHGTVTYVDSGTWSFRGDNGQASSGHWRVNGEVLETTMNGGNRTVSCVILDVNSNDYIVANQDNPSQKWHATRVK